MLLELGDSVLLIWPPTAVPSTKPRMVWENAGLGFAGLMSEKAQIFASVKQTYRVVATQRH